MSARAGKTASQRQLRVGEALRHLLADILQRSEFRDPDLKDAAITLTEVRISPDLRNATGYIMPLGGVESDRVVVALNRAAGYLRSQVGRVSTLRHTPQFQFALDHSFDEVDKVEALFRREKVRADLARPAEEDAAEEDVAASCQASDPEQGAG